MNKAWIILLLCCCGLKSSGQDPGNGGGPETLNPLRVNAPLSKVKKPSNSPLMKSPGAGFYFTPDTIPLPFLDDFSAYYLKSYDTSKYDQSKVFEAVGFAFTAAGVPVSNFVCAAETTWSYLYSDVVQDSLISKTPLTMYQIVRYQDPNNPFKPTDTTYCWSPFEVYDTLTQLSPDTIDSLGIVIDTLINVFDTLKVYHPDTGVGGKSLSLWIDEDAFINTRYAVNPPTTGVATLDGLNEFGIPHNGFSDPFGYGVADYLTSKPIALADTMNNVYLSFYYQPQGIGNDPQAEDSLALEFYSPADLGWHNIWSVPGKGLQNFRHVIVPVSGSQYLKSGFQFRFKNYATLSGALDHWHIDYVRLNKNRSSTDSLIVDVGAVEATRSIYKSYEAVPWKHYLADTTLALVDDMYCTMRNLDSVINKTQYHYVIRHNDGITDSALVFPTGTNSKDVPGQDTLIRRLPLDYYCSWSAEKDSATFEIIAALEPETKDVNPDNDTLRYNQRFYNYYAYDDGTAEAGYGLNAEGARLAYQFTTIIPDTLRAVDMYFAQDIYDQSEELFYLTVWSSLSPENIIYQREYLTPVYEDSLNEFHTYLLDSVLLVSGTYYIGWVQLSDQILNIGYDLNGDASDKVFYNVAGTWLQSLLGGTVMMRPLFGDTVVPPVGMAETGAVQGAGSRFIVYPNPADAFIQLKLYADEIDRASIGVTVSDLYGREVLTADDPSGYIDTRRLADGIYFVKLMGQAGVEHETRKIIIAH